VAKVRRPPISTNASKPFTSSLKPPTPIKQSNLVVSCQGSTTNEISIRDPFEDEEDMFKSYDARSRQAVISDSLKLVQQETLGLNDSVEHVAQVLFEDTPSKHLLEETLSPNTNRSLSKTRRTRSSRK